MPPVPPPLGRLELHPAKISVAKPVARTVVAIHLSK
jgi:hypothetical protein